MSKYLREGDLTNEIKSKPSFAVLYCSHNQQNPHKKYDIWNKLEIYLFAGPIVMPICP